MSTAAAGAAGDAHFVRALSCRRTGQAISNSVQEGSRLRFAECSTEQMSSALGRQRGRQALSPRVAAPNRRNSILKKELTTPEKENTGNHVGAGSNPRGKKSSSKGDRKRRVSFSATIDVLKFDARKFDAAPCKVEVAKTKLAPVPRYALNERVFFARGSLRRRGPAARAALA